MITYEQIAKANKTIKMVDIKGKDYAEVNQRIKAFRMICPNGSIETEIISNDGSVCVIRAIVMDEAGNLLGTGTAYEKEGSSFINKTSYIENCETSAVGRALAMCGIGIDAVASLEEFQNATLQQEEEKENTVEHVKKELERTGVKAAQILKAFKVETLEEMTEAQIGACLSKLYIIETKENK